MMLTIWTSYIAAWLPIVCVTLAIVAAMHDVIARTVPNSLVLTLAITAFANAAASGHLIGSLISAFCLFAAALLCWQRGWMGGGDVKLIGAAALAIPASMTLTFIAVVAISGSLLAGFYLAAGRLMPARRSTRPSNLFARALRAERWRISRGGSLPYACAIAAGLLFVIV
jgi:prepilin peptidase CpaA